MRPGGRSYSHWTWKENASMQWTPGGVSGDIEDRRSQGGGGFRGVHLGLGATIVLLLLSVIFKRDFLSVFTQSPGAGSAVNRYAGRTVEDPAEAKEVQFVSFVLD